MSKGGDSGSQTSTSRVELPPWVDAAAQQNLAFANKIASIPYKPFSGERIAPFTAPQTEAQNRALQFARSGIGYNQLADAQGSTAGAANYQPGSFLDNVGAYMNPYTQNVTDATMAGLDRARQTALMGNADSAAKAGAFGGSRHGVVDAETNRNYFDTAARTLAGLNSDAYNNASTMFNQDVGNQLRALGLNLTGARQLADLGTLGRSYGMQDIDTLNTTGGAQQAQQQRLDDYRYQQYKDAQDWPLRQLAIRNSTLSAVPYGQTTSSTGTMSSPQTNPLGSALGGAMLGSSLFGTGGALAGALGMGAGGGAALGGGLGLLAAFL